MPDRTTRREALRIIGQTAAVAACGVSAGCGSRPSGPQPVRIPLADLAVGQRLTVTVGLQPIEITRTRDGVRARLLWCTHMGCRVAWDDERQRYLCPCHEGEFDGDGSPVAGPPLLPLRDAPVRIEGDRIVVGP